MPRSVESLSHDLDAWAEAVRPARDARLRRVVAQVLTDDGRVRADRMAGFLPPAALPLDAVETGSLVDVDPPSIAAGATVDVTLAIPDAAENDAVLLGPPSTLPMGVTFVGFVSAPGTVTLRLTNGGGATANPGLDTWRVVLAR